jgi:hypothetical protein
MFAAATLAGVPVVLVTAHGEPRAGYTYDDRTGISYEYPDGRYEPWITTGDRFVYHTPDLGYTGAGVIGEIRSSATAGRLVCDILDYEPWEPPVPLKDVDGQYFEADPRVWTNGRVYWAQGVRRILEDRYDLILAAASAAAPAPAAWVETRGAGRARPAGGARGYASPAVNAAVDAYAMTAAMGHVASLWPTHSIEQMPRNNPGFDIRVGQAGAEDWYYEVKGTQASEPLFFMSEGERKFSLRQASRYTLLVVVGIDLRNGIHASIIRRDGEVGGADVELETAQWRGRLLAK